VCTRCRGSLNLQKESTFWGWIVIGILLATGIVAIHFWVNSPKTVKKIPLVTKSIPHARPFSSPEQALPLNGTTQWFTFDKPTAPFIVTGKSGSHCLVKLYDFYTQKPIMTVFVYDKATVQVKIPLGTYELKYATGEKWYGYDYLFGPTTVYQKAEKKLEFFASGNQQKGHRVTLHPVPQGNLPTSTIKASQF
jgi:hypothetical protein